MEAAIKNTNNLLSKMATNDGHGENSPYFDGWKAYDANPFDLLRNPTGVIQMGLAENKVYIICLSLLISKQKKKLPFLVYFCFTNMFVFIRFSALFRFDPRMG